MKTRGDLRLEEVAEATAGYSGAELALLSLRATELAKRGRLNDVEQTAAKLREYNTRRAFRNRFLAFQRP
jgi:hypothetical protein